MVGFSGTGPEFDGEDVHQDTTDGFAETVRIKQK